MDQQTVLIVYQQQLAIDLITPVDFGEDIAGHQVGHRQHGHLKQNHRHEEHFEKVDRIGQHHHIDEVAVVENIDQMCRSQILAPELIRLDNLIEETILCREI